MRGLLVLFSLCFWLEPASAQKPTFQNDVMPVLSRTGCNSGPCHGNLNGKGGFKLSLRGESPAIDLQTLTRESLGRRVSISNPEESLILKKATGQVPHEGGIRFSTSSPEYTILRDWISAGCPKDGSNLPVPTKLIVTPPSRIALDPIDHVKLTVEAEYSDGTRRNITHLATFETTTVGIARVLPSGEVIREQTGELIVLVRYVTLQVPVRIVFLPKREVPQLGSFNTSHPIDRSVLQHWQELRLQPAQLSTDAQFLRRVYLDTCGLIPTADEAKAFLTSTDPSKRSKLIDELLDRDEFASFWAQKWSDLLRNEERSLDRKGVQVFFHWIKGWLSEDKPLNEFAREILAARGSTYANPAANFYRSIRDPYLRAESAAQVFLGLRISCARCHNHPFDRWTQDDYHRFSAHFARIDYRVLENRKRDDLDKHEFVGDQIVMSKQAGELPHPRGGNATPKLLTDAQPSDLATDRLLQLANWVASPDNPFLAQAQVNRIWLHLLGRGLVDPNDDFRASNPPSNPELLNHLVAEFRRGGMRLKPMVKHILTSQTYQLSSSPNPANPGEEVHLVQAMVQPLEAEQLLAGMSQVLGMPVKFPGYPQEMRIGDLPATPLNAGKRNTESKGMRFLKVFGKPDRLLTCECERSEDPGMLQAFQLLTGELMQSLLRDSNNRLGQRLASSTSDAEILEEFYLAALSRFPTPAEKEQLLKHLQASKDRRAAWEDIIWALLNSKEFLLRR
jgi:hypothetical protein